MKAFLPKFILSEINSTINHYKEQITQKEIDLKDIQEYLVKTKLKLQNLELFQKELLSNFKKSK